LGLILYFQLLLLPVVAVAVAAIRLMHHRLVDQEEERIHIALIMARQAQPIKVLPVGHRYCTVSAMAVAVAVADLRQSVVILYRHPKQETAGPA
jgi:hypothetical protein